MQIMQVEVEVLKNAYGPGETHRTAFSVAEGAMHDTKTEIKKRLAHAPDELRRAETGLVHAAEDIEHEAGKKVSEVEHKFKRAVGSDDSTSRRSRPGTAGTTETSDHGLEEEEGWMSDHEAEASSPGDKDGRKKSKSPKSKSKLSVSKPLGVITTSRRRQSFRRSALTGIRPHQGRSASDGQIVIITDGEEDSEDHRGRRSTPRGEHRPSTSASSTSLIPPTSPGSLRHHRIDSLRSSRHHSRELSPSRSIRWADEQDVSESYRQGTMTPILLSPSSPATPLPGSEAPSDNEEVTKTDKADESPTSATQVRFDIPLARERSLV